MLFHPGQLLVWLLQVLLFITADDQIRDDDLDLDYETVTRLSGLPQHCYNTQYPYKLGQVLNSREELLTPAG